MNRSRKDGTPRGGARCPYCKTFYRHGSMARACQKTFWCRYHNAPGGLRKEFMDAQLKTSICVWFLLTPLKENPQRRLRARAMSLDACMEPLYRDLRRFFAYSNSSFDAATKPTMRLLYSLWAPDVPVDITHVAAVFSSLVSDLRFRLGPFWAKCSPEMRAPRLWAGIERQLDGIYDYCDPDGTEAYPHVDEVQPLYDRLHNAIWPSRPAPEMHLYLSGERFWISARTKAEAREILRAETGLVGLTVKGIALGERLSDGRTAGELLSLAGGKPGIIALAQ